jgi:alkanesulfonate monooxygenase
VSDNKPCASTGYQTTFSKNIMDIQPPITIRSAGSAGIEVAWFAPLCDEDDEFLGAKDAQFKSSWQNTSQILLTADRLGFDNILCPSSYAAGMDTWTFASAVAPLTQQMNLLAALALR